MRRHTRHLLLSLAFFGGSAAFVLGQEPAQPKLPAAKDDEKKDDKKAPPPATPERAPVTFPATANNSPIGAIGAATTAIAATALPPVYGDNLTFTLYTPYLRATTPNGQEIAVPPGQRATFPLGTTFNQNVPTRIVQVPTGEFQTIVDPDTQKPIRVPINVNRVEVTGSDAIANRGGIPFNVLRGAYKIGENESPRPQDRIYATYNYFYDVNASLGIAGLPITNVHRQTIGVEKTFLEGDASIGLRLPLLQVSGARNVEAQGLGDISVILKYAIINEYVRNDDGSLSPGNLLSAGLVVTAPTGTSASFTSTFPVVHSTLIQPWVGGIYISGKTFVQGFSSVAIPTDETDTTFLFNSLQVGYRLYQNPNPSGLLRSMSPILEAHVATPLNNRGLELQPVGSIDVVNLTAGATFGLGSRSFLNLGFNVPVTGPKPYGLEAIVQLNMFY